VRVNYVRYICTNKEERMILCVCLVNFLRILGLDPASSRDSAGSSVT